uniref:Cytochrome c oxidase subunit 2 n=1 Tax=Cyanothece sp. (strain PCC 7425 / ATCC 29141) TaxID=395961 RepID=B8HUS1_CYAP4
MNQIPASILTLTAGIVVTLISFWVGQHHGLLPEQASAQAPLVDSLFNLMMTISTALLLVVMGAMVLFIIQFRRRPGDDSDGLPIEGSLPLEAFWTAVPAIIVIILGVYSVDVFERIGGFNPGDHTHHTIRTLSQHPTSLVAQAHVGGDMAPLMAQGVDSETKTLPTYGYGADPNREGKAADVVVNVTGLQYAWIFNYPDSGVVSGELHVPVGKDVQLNLAAQDVIHSLWVPQFRLKQDAIPGEKTELRFTATKVGDYPVVCAELCGSYHGSMRTRVYVQTPEEYEQWIQQTKVAQSTDPQSAIAVTTPGEATVLAQTEAMGITPHVLAQLPHGPIE